jgi:hypothetical protein
MRRIEHLCMRCLVQQLCILSAVFIAATSASADEEMPVYLRDRGTGVPTSMFGTYIRRREILVYPFYEFYYDHNAEYDPSETGYGPEADYVARYVAHEGLVYFAYGITDWLMIEVEAAVISATQWKADEDTTQTPDSIHEAGLGDVEGEVRWRYFPEREIRPELFGYFETVLPLQPDRRIIGTSAWEFKFGAGIMKGFAFGTFTGRVAVEYDAGEEKFEVGEYALEYLKRISTHFSVFGMIEGSQDEVELVAELNLHFNEHVTLKIGSGFGLTEKATDIAPETGLIFSFGR